VVCKTGAAAATGSSCAKDANGNDVPTVWTGGDSGNPGLKPWRAKAYDLSLEKYFGKRSYVAFAGYYKQMESWVYNQQLMRDFTGVLNTSKLPTPASPFGLANVPANGKGGYIHGAELTVTLDGSIFSNALEGFGITANATDAAANLRNKDGNLVVPEGLSGQSTNLTAYYERNGFSARVSQRHRSPFVSTYRSVVFSNVTTKINSDDVVDMQLGYAFEQGAYKGLSIMFQVNNLTDSATQQMQSINTLGGNNPTPDTSQLVTKWINRYGRQMLFGVNYKF
jgi:iron complex outermembrane receptor protein